MNRSASRAAALLLSASLAACSSTTEPADDGTPVRIDLGGPAVPLLAASSDRLYALMPTSSTTQSVEARRLGGQSVWKVSTSSCGNECFLALDASGNVYFNTVDGVTSRAGSNGDLRWSASTGRAASIAVGSNGLVYAANRPFAVPQRLHALRAADGSIAWITSLLPGFDATAILLDESRSTVYAVGRGRAAALDVQTGFIKWTSKNDCFGGTQGAIAANGTLYITCDNDFSSVLVALNPNGTAKWAVSLGTTNGTWAPVIDAAGTVYVANSGSVTALTPEGAISWQLAGLSNNRVSPAVTSNNDVYIEASQSNGVGRTLLVVNGGVIVEDKGQAGCERSFLLTSSGRVYCAVAGGALYFQGSSKDITGQWSQLGRDAERTSRR